MTVSCKTETITELPYEEEKVVHMLGDMHFARSAAKIYKAEMRDSMKLVFENQVYAIHEISKKEFNELKYLLESDLKLYYDIEKKVHEYLKTVQNEKQ